MPGVRAPVHPMKDTYIGGMRQRVECTGHLASGKPCQTQRDQAIQKRCFVCGSDSYRDVEPTAGDAASNESRS